MSTPNLLNADRVQIERRKLTEYLLARAHPVGRGKARFFERLGFSAANPEALESALRALVLNPDTVIQEDTGFGTKYILDGQLRGPVGAAPVRTIWIIDAGADTPRFVTAYPRREL